MSMRGFLCSLAVAALLGSAGTPLARAADTPIPSGVQAALQGAVGEWIKSQTDGSENEYGKPTKRGYYSRFFEPVDNDTYHATAHIETAGDETKTTQRYLLTLSKDGTKWKVAGAELRDTYQGMRRSTAATCRGFERFSFDREGMHLAGTNGQVCAVYRLGRVQSFAVHAADGSYRYEPPEYAKDLHMAREIHSIFESMEKDHERELEFTPAAFLFTCDPESCDALLDEHFEGLAKEAPPQEGQWVWNQPSAPAWAQSLAQEWQKNRRENPFVNFTTDYEEGHRVWAVYVPRALEPFSYPGTEEGFADFSGSFPGPGVRLVYNNWGGFEVAFQVWPRRIDVPDQLFGTLYGYYSEETLKTSNPYEIETRDDEDARWDEVYSIQGTVDLALEDPEVLSADMTFGIRLKKPLRELPFFIQSIRRQDFTGKDKPRELEVNAVQLDGEELTWTRTSQLGGLIVLPEEMPEGTKLNLRMGFKTRAMYKVTPSFTAVSRFGWMPFVRFGDFIDDFELTIRSPADYDILGIGHEADRRVEGNLLVTHWKADNPVVFPSITFGRYRSDTAGKGFKPATKADGTPIPVTVHVDEASFASWGIPPSNLRPIAQQAVNSINLYREISGIDYPYGELNFVNDPQGFLYGQAPSSLIYLGQGVFRGEGFLATLPFFRDATSISKFLKSVVAHEVGHQWWGSRVSNANNRNYWFVESLAEYFSAVFLQAVHGQKDYDEQVDEWRRTILNNRLKSSVQNASSTWSGEDGFGSYQAAVYNKGPYAFHMLREIFGDEKFFEFLKKFSNELSAKREIVTLDIQHAAEKALGGVDPDGNPYNVDLGWFFDQWIRGTGIPQYRFVYDVRQSEEGAWLIEGTVEQRVMLGSSRANSVLEGTYYRGVVYLTVKGKGGKDYKHRLVVEGPSTPFQLKVPEKPLEVALNDGGATLAHDVLENRSW